MKLGKPRWVNMFDLLLLSICQLSEPSWYQFDGATHQTEEYLDVRMDFSTGRDMQNVHLLAIPMGKRARTATHYTELVLGWSWCGREQVRIPPLNLAVGVFVDALKRVGFRSLLSVEILFTRTDESVRSAIG
ncbi:hypothetical protein GQ600_6356 [Phytophthora cactorum]|nr:hypothetical protein GQ600_6356 [Phytophthora cactorum]